jgi:hypothetical protein
MNTTELQKRVYGYGKKCQIQKYFFRGNKEQITFQLINQLPYKSNSRKGVGPIFVRRCWYAIFL